jgi:hypothetical protein
MITDPGQRFALAKVGDTHLWRYDKRWWSTRLIEPAEGEPFTFVEGRHHAIVVVERDGRIDVSVRGPADPETPLATGSFDGKWVFEGNSQMWSTVPDFILVNDGLLRIADDATIDPLDGFVDVVSVTPVPDSRLVVITSNGAYTVYDAVARRSIRHYELTGKNPSPVARFRNDDELWLSDRGTMLKLDTKQFEVIDAAGTELDGEAGPEKEGEGRDPSLEELGPWALVANGELCAVTRPNLGDVLLLDGLSMLPVARAVFAPAIPTDAILMGRNLMVAVDERGGARRARSRPVRINFVD